MADFIDSYFLGDIKVVIEETENSDKLSVTCNDGHYRSQFTIHKYEYKHYKRHMNQRIKNAYKEEHESNE